MWSRGAETVRAVGEGGKNGRRHRRRLYYHRRRPHGRRLDQNFGIKRLEMKCINHEPKCIYHVC